MSAAVGDESPVDPGVLLDYVIRVRDSLDTDHDPNRDEGLNLLQVRKAYLYAEELGLVRPAECAEDLLSRDGARRKLDHLISLLRPLVPSDRRTGSKSAPESCAAAERNTVLAVVQLYVGGAATNDRIRAVAAIIENPDFTVTQKLAQIDSELPIPAAASAEKLSELLGVSKTAVMKSEWWEKHRRGKRQDEESQRLARHEKRRQRLDPNDTGQNW